MFKPFVCDQVTQETHYNNGSAWTMADQEIGHFNSWEDTFQAWQKTFEIFELTER